MSEQVDLATILNSAGEDSPDRLQLYAKNIAESITQYKVFSHEVHCIRT